MVKKVVVYMDEELYRKFLKLAKRKGMFRSALLYEITKERLEAMYEEEFRTETKN